MGDDILRENNIRDAPSLCHSLLKMQIDMVCSYHPMVCSLLPTCKLSSNAIERRITNQLCVDRKRFSQKWTCLETLVCKNSELMPQLRPNALLQCHSFYVYHTIMIHKNCIIQPHEKSYELKDWLWAHLHLQAHNTILCYKRIIVVSSGRTISTLSVKNSGKCLMLH